MSTTILVTGATGNVGRATLRALAARDPEAQIRAATRRPEAYPAPAGNVTPVRLDYNDPESFAPALEGVDRLFLMSAPMDADAAPKLTALLEEAKRAGVAQVVLMTAMGVEHAPHSPLGQVETALKASGLEWTLLRPNWFMENLHPGFMASMVMQGALALPAGDASVSLITTEDIGEAAAVTLLEAGHAGREYTLTGPESLNWGAVAQQLSADSGRAVAYVPVSDEDMRQGMTAAGLPASAVDYLSVLFGAMRAGASEPVTADLPGLIGRPPRSFEQFAKQHATAWK